MTVNGGRRGGWEKEREEAHHHQHPSLCVGNKRLWELIQQRATSNTTTLTCSRVVSGDEEGQTTNVIMLANHEKIRGVS